MAVEPIRWEDGVRHVLEYVVPLPVVQVGLADALGRTLAESIRSDLDAPPFDRATMDGYTVRSADVAGAPVTLDVVGQIGAGCKPDRALDTGQAIQINTGAPIPGGADAVVRVEDTAELDDGRRVRVDVSVDVGCFIARRGTFVRAGDVVLPAGGRVGPLEMAVAASVGACELPVHRAPRVAILSTGDELVDITETPTGPRIRNSNQHLLEALVRQARCEPVVLGIARDDPADLETKVRRGLDADMLLVTGGVSMGRFDLVPDVLRRCGVVDRFHKVAIKPGRPTFFGTGDGGRPVFGLPGNPISGFVGFHLFVTAALDRLEGRKPTPVQPMAARLNEALPATRDRVGFQPGRTAVSNGGALSVSPLRWHGSGDPFGMIGADALIVRPQRQPPAQPGATVGVLLLRR